MPAGVTLPPEARSLTLCAASTLPFSASARLRGVAWRRDASHGATYAGATGHLVVSIGTVVSAAHPTVTFRRLFREPPTVVHDGPIQLPAASPPGGGAAPFSVVVPFGTPWTYTGGDLGVDVSFQGVAAGVWRRDAVRLGDVIPGTVTPLGIGCWTTGGYAPLHWVDATTAVPGATMRVHLEGGPLRPHSLAAAHMLGSGAATYHGVPLPIDVGMLGFPPGCLLRTDVLVNLVAPPADYSTLYSRAQIGMPVPNRPTFVGLRLSGQWLVLDLAQTTPIQAVLSSAETWTLGSAPASAPTFYGRTIWIHGRSRDVPDSGGQIGPRNYVAVTRFDY